MANRLGSAISPYLRSHADNPVDWYAWGTDAFDDAVRRDVPVLVSIGYSSCHWCHVMARESFSDPELAAFLNDHFVAIKVDREEHPEVDASYLSAASAFTEHLGWPLNVFVTPRGKAFFAGTYFPPEPLDERASFRQVLAAITEAWSEQRSNVEDSAEHVADAVSRVSFGATSDTSELPGPRELDTAAALMERHEDPDFGGFGGAPKFPVAPALGFLLSRDSSAALGARTLKVMAGSPLRDAVEGGFFRYSTRRDWADPHYERMLYDNALLLDDYTTAWQLHSSGPDNSVQDGSGPDWAAEAADGIAGFLVGVMQLPGGGFASAQDSESVIDGARVEGGYYALDVNARARLSPPARDEKVLTGWNGLAIAALARAGFAFDKANWIAAAREAADFLIREHLSDDGGLVRASLGSRASDAPATLEDYGAFAAGLLALAAATGDVLYAVTARRLVDAVLPTASNSAPEFGDPFVVPGGGDPVLSIQGLGVRIDPSEGAYPSGLTLCAEAAHALFLLTGDRAYEGAARSGMRLVGARALENPMAFGGALGLMSRLAAEPVQLVIVVPDATADANRTDIQAVLAVARRCANTLVAVVSDAQASAFIASGFELFDGRSSEGALARAYFCRDFVCALPVTDADALTELVRR
jgi:uncharacterized protein YyaL (SSP411 family)